MKASETQKFELALMSLSVIAAFLWGAYLGDHFPYKLDNSNTQSVMGTSTEQEVTASPTVDLPLEPNYYECNSNSDCVAVARTCCGCEKGGEMIAVNRQKAEEYLLSLDCEFSGENCVEINTCHPREPICDLGMCYLKEPTADEATSRIDLDLDTKIGAGDYAVFLNEYLKCKTSGCEGLLSDLDGDQEVTIHDFYIFMDNMVQE